jgi:hypothetical protein
VDGYLHHKQKKRDLQVIKQGIKMKQKEELIKARGKQGMG